VVSKSFASPADASSFFSDHVLDLGAVIQESELQLVFDLSMVGNFAGDGFGDDFIFGAATSAFIPPATGSPVPEPSSLSLLLSAAATLLWWRKPRRKR